MKIKSIFKRFAAVLSAIFLFVGTFAVSALPMKAEVTVYSDVMTDLTESGVFNAEAYPGVSDDYSLQLIQIAESSDGELFLYVYQPSHATKDLMATSVNMSANSDGTLDNHLYHLTLVSTHGVFDKYVVDGLKVSSDSVRVYQITSLFRSFDEAIDSATGNDNTISEVAYNVGKKWTAFTSNGDTYYVQESIETIQVTGKYVGSIRYNDTSLSGLAVGTSYYTPSLDSFYVGFKTDKNIENLLSVVVYANVYVKKAEWDIYFGVYSGQGSTRSDSVEKRFEVNRGEKHSFKVTDFLRGDKVYTWDEIQTVDEFFEQENLTVFTSLEEAKDEMDWVLRFFHAPVYEDESTFLGIGSKTRTTYHVEDVTIVQLTYKCDDAVYVVGVVDNKQTGSENPSGVVTTEGLLDQILKWVITAVCLIISIMLIVMFGPQILTLVLKVLYWLIKGLFAILWWIVCLPFKLLREVFNRDENDGKD